MYCDILNTGGGMCLYEQYQVVTPFPFKKIFFFFIFDFDMRERERLE